MAAAVGIIGNNADFNLEQIMKPSSYTTGDTDPLWSVQYK